MTDKRFSGVGATRRVGDPGDRRRRPSDDHEGRSLVRGGRGHPGSRRALSTTASGWMARTPCSRIPRSRWQPHGVHGLSRVFDPSEHVWGDAAWTGRRLAGGVLYETARRHVHARGDVRRGDRPARPPAVDRRRPAGDPSGERVRRSPQLGLRRCALVRRAARLRGPARLPAVRRRLSPAGHRRRPGRRLQPSRQERQLPATVRAVPQRRGRDDDLGRVGQPGRADCPTRCADTSWTTS